MLQAACDRGEYNLFEKYAAAVNDREQPIQLRDLLDFKPAGPSEPLERVQSVNEIRKRFVTPGMSLGALSPEAHGTLNVAMNRIGAKVGFRRGRRGARALPAASKRRQYEFRR